MTTWVEQSEGGRSRGFKAIGRAWVEVLVRPTRFFETGVAPGDQAPGLTFALTVVAVAAGTHLALRPAYAVVLGDYPTLSVVVVFLLYVLVVAPLVLHLAAALETVGLTILVSADRRGGVSETVQVIGYASAPCVFVGLPFPLLRITCVAYGMVLLVIGTVVVHRTDWWWAAVVSVLPGGVVFGYGFGGIAAIESTLLAVS